VKETTLPSLFHILHIEDDEVDAEMVVRALRTHRLDTPYTLARDGVEARSLLRGQDGHPRLSQPYVILMDINLPRMNGIEFLHVLRQDADLERSIVFVLTTSNRDEDKVATYNEQIAGYILKAKAGEDVRRVLRLLDSYNYCVEFPPEV